MNNGIQIVLICMTLMSFVGFFAMGVDKIKAKKNAWRIPEKTLLFMAFIGGGVGVWLSMEVFRHKTKHLQFKYGVPLIAILEFIAVCYVFSS